MPILAGERAPVSGTIIDDETLRKIDLSLTGKEMCEQRLKQLPPCLLKESGASGMIYFLAGVLVTGIVTLAVLR